MSRITDYGFLFQTTFGTSKTNLVNNIQLFQMNSSSVQKQLKAAGINTNSKKYKAALSEKPLILHGKLGNQYRLVHWMALPESLLRVARNQ